MTLHALAMAIIFWSGGVGRTGAPHSNVAVQATTNCAAESQAAWDAEHLQDAGPFDVSAADTRSGDGCATWSALTEEWLTGQTVQHSPPEELP